MSLWKTPGSRATGTRTGWAGVPCRTRRGAQCQASGHFPCPVSFARIPRPPAPTPTPASVPGRLWGPHPVEGTQWGVNERVSERMNWVLDPLPLLFHLSSVPGAGGGAAGRWEGARS